MADGTLHTCKVCKNAEQRDYRAANPEKFPTVFRSKSVRWADHLWYEYRITPEEYQALINMQGGGCYLCGSPDHLCVDHCHETEEIRGILCKSCNSAIGKLGDNEAGLLRAIAYLKDYKLNEETTCCT